MYDCLSQAESYPWAMNWHVFSFLTSHSLAPLHFAPTKALGSLPLPHIVQSSARSLLSLEQTPSFLYPSRTLGSPRRTSHTVQAVDGRSIASQFKMLEPSSDIAASVDDPPIRGMQPHVIAGFCWNLQLCQ
jgi:hypothetical protein